MGLCLFVRTGAGGRNAAVPGARTRSSVARMLCRRAFLLAELELYSTVLYCTPSATSLLAGELEDPVAAVRRLRRAARRTGQDDAAVSGARLSNVMRQPLSYSQRYRGCTVLESPEHCLACRLEWRSSRRVSRSCWPTRPRRRFRRRRRQQRPL